MNSISRVFVLLLLPSIALSEAQNLLATLVRCGTNEVYTGGSGCVETCNSKPQLCTQIYKTGCFCKEGYVRQSNAAGSPCIKREKCEEVKETQECGGNEEYSTCGSACPPTCDDFRYPLPKPPKACITLCRAGCFCKKGYYRSDKGTCVLPKNCCGENEQYKTCGSACVETCSEKPTYCTKQCVPGCFCACSDYVRENNSTGNACIRRDDCPQSNECDEEED